MAEFRFKGGSITLNRGPDDYLIKPIEGGKWTLVVFQYGRNFTGDAEAAKADFEAARMIHKQREQVCVPDMARRYQRMKEWGAVPAMSGVEFLAKYGAEVA